MLGQNADVRIWANRMLPPAPVQSWESSIDRCISLSEWFPTERIPLPGNTLNSIQNVLFKCPPLCRDVSLAVDELKFRPSSLMVQDASIFNLLGISRVCVRKNLKASFYFHTNRHNKAVKLFAPYLRAHRRRFSFAAIHHSVADIASRALGLPVRMVPWPGDVTLRSQTAEGGSFEVAVLGRCRPEQVSGLNHIPSEKLIRLLTDGSMVLHLPSPFKESLFFKQLSPRARERVIFRPSRLSDDAYRELLCSSHAVLLPYSAGDYQSKLSAIAEEATIAGIPFVIPRETLTWNTYEAEGICCGYNEEDPAGMSEAIGHIFQNYGGFRMRSESFAQKTRIDHSIHRFLRSMEGFPADE
ncbi:MAG: hypothetical protein SynsKO_11850 [Synoicihabitans sp.]